MTRKTARELWPIIKAFGEGKDIEIKTTTGWMIQASPVFTEINIYRIKPEPVYIHFEWKDWKEFMGKNVIDKNGDCWLIVGLDRDEIIIERDEDGKCFRFKDAFLKLKFADGAPFGKLQK